MTIQKISVLGGGAWGTALALTAARVGRDVTLWEHDASNAESLEQKRESRFLPGVRLEDTIKVTRDLAAAARNDAILLVVPAQVVRSVVTALAPSLPDAHAADRLRQGHRARHPQVHERDHRGMREQRGAGDPVGAELRRRRGARVAHRGDARRPRRRHRRRARASDRVEHVPALSFDRPARRRARRRHQERLRHRRRHRRRPRAGRQRGRGARSRAASPSSPASARPMAPKSKR